MAPKRKLEEGYSNNPHTIKARKRVADMTDEQKAVHKAKDKLRVAIRRALKALEATADFKNTSTANQQALSQSKRNEIEEK